jgi:plastocyanin
MLSKLKHGHALPASLLLVGVLALAGCGGGSDNTESAGGGAESTTEAEAGGATETETGANAPAPSGEAVRAEKVEIENFAYNPDPVTIQAGGKVIWINRDSAPHTATADDGSFDTGTLEEGKLKSETFKQPGTYAYHCEIHPEMHGTIEVVESG